MRHCIRDGCGMPFDDSKEAIYSEHRKNLRAFWHWYCPKHRIDPIPDNEPIVNREDVDAGR